MEEFYTEKCFFMPCAAIITFQLLSAGVIVTEGDQPPSFQVCIRASVSVGGAFNAFIPAADITVTPGSAVSPGNFFQSSIHS